MFKFGTPRKSNITLRSRTSRPLFDTISPALATGDTTDEEAPDPPIQDNSMPNPGASGGAAPTSTSTHVTDAPPQAAEFGTSAGGSYHWQSRGHRDGTGTRTPGPPKRVLPEEMCHICLVAAYDYQVR